MINIPPSDKQEDAKKYDSSKPIVNSKKRKLNQSLNYGAGMDDYHKEPEMFEIESHLPFLRYKSDDKNLRFELLRIDVSDKHYSIALSLYPQQSIGVSQPMKKILHIENTLQRVRQLKMVHQEFDPYKNNKR